MLLGTDDVMNSASPLMPGTDSALSAWQGEDRERGGGEKWVRVGAVQRDPIGLRRHGNLCSFSHRFLTLLSIYIQLNLLNGRLIVI